jgi:hypothetical protein
MFEYTENEKNQVLEKYFINDGSLQLVIFPKKQKQKYLCLLWIADMFQKEKDYSEKEVNALLEPVYPDYVMVRRYLVDYDLLNRTPDGSRYWV